MNLPVITTHNIAELFNKEEIVLDTIKQIQKDFDMYGIELHFTGEVAEAYNQMMQQLTPQLTRLLVSERSKLQSVLYRVDLSEKSLQKAIENTPDKTLPEVMAHEIIVRELKKVLTRHYFKSLE